jgi:ERCC4-type nuclease
VQLTLGEQKVKITATLYVDDREVERPNPMKHGMTSGVDMVELFRRHPDCPPVEKRRLEAGDFQFTGEGPEAPVVVGVERKRVTDMLNSIRTGRFSGEQLPKLLRIYDYVFLVLEGTATWRTNFRSGLLERRKGSSWEPLMIGKQVFTGLELDSYLNDIVTCTPIKVHLTRDAEDTVSYVLGLMHSFSKPWEKRNHHVAIHRPTEYVQVRKASTLRRILYTLDSVGWERSSAAEDYFLSKYPHSPVEGMMQAAISEWTKIPGFGREISKKVWEQLHGA